MKIVNVFTHENGKFGNPVGIVVDTKNELNRNHRQEIATESGLSEVVFINDLDRRSVSIYTPQNEIPFAGHALVGTAYFLNHEYKMSVSELVGIGGIIPVWQEAGLTWVRGNLDILPPWNYKQLDKPAKIEELSAEQESTREHTFIWAWIDADKGIIRARTFATDWGIPEDEANGSGAMRLASLLSKKLTIHHGKGSHIHARPCGANAAEVGGLVIVQAHR